MRNGSPLCKEVCNLRRRVPVPHTHVGGRVGATDWLDIDIDIGPTWSISWHALRNSPAMPRP
jgi:hypothetical protein